MTAPWNRQAQACPVSPCRVDRLFHGENLRQRVRDARRAAGREWRAEEELPPLQGVLRPVQGVPGAVQGPPSPVCSEPARPGDIALWHLLDTAGSNFFSPLGIAETIEKGLRVTPCGEAIATIQPTALWMRELGHTMRTHGLDNSSAVLLGAQQQLYALDESPRDRIGETVYDPSAEEFPVQLFRASKTTLRARPAPASPTSSTRTWGQSSATRSSSPQRLVSEGPS